MSSYDESNIDLNNPNKNTYNNNKFSFWTLLNWLFTIFAFFFVISIFVFILIYFVKKLKLKLQNIKCNDSINVHDNLYFNVKNQTFIDSNCQQIDSNKNIFNNLQKIGFNYNK